MTQALNFVAGAGALVLLTGCIEDTGGSASQLPLAPGSPPFITTMGPDVTQAAIDSCRAALDAATNGNVIVVGGETSRAATAIYMRVGANGAPWRCLVSPTGRKPSLMSMGDEGAA